VKRELLYFPKLYLNLSPDIVSFFPPSPSCDISIIPMRILSFTIAVVGSLGTVVQANANYPNQNQNDGETEANDSKVVDLSETKVTIDSPVNENAVVPDNESGGTVDPKNQDLQPKPSAVTDENDDGSNIIISNEQYVSLDTSTTTLEAILNRHNTVYNNIKDLHSKLQSLGTLTVEAAARIALLSALADLSSRTSQNTVSVDEGVKDCAAMIDIVLGELGNVAKQAEEVVVVGPENGGASGQHGAEQVTEHNNEDQSATAVEPGDDNQEKNSAVRGESQSNQASTSNPGESSSAGGTETAPRSDSDLQKNQDVLGGLESVDI